MWLERLLYSIKNCFFFFLLPAICFKLPITWPFFSISLEGSSYLGSTVQSKGKKNTNYPSAHSCTALTCSFSLLVMLLAAVASDCSVSILLFRSWFTWIPMPDDMRSNPQDSTWPITETKKKVQPNDWKILIIDCYPWKTCACGEKRWYGTADKNQYKNCLHVTRQACIIGTQKLPAPSPPPPPPPPFLQWS